MAWQLNWAGVRKRNGVSWVQRKPSSSQGYVVPPPWFSISTTTRWPDSIICPSVGHRWAAASAGVGV